MKLICPGLPDQLTRRIDDARQDDLAIGRGGFRGVFCSHDAISMNAAVIDGAVGPTHVVGWAHWVMKARAGAEVKSGRTHPEDFLARIPLLGLGQR